MYGTLYILNAAIHTTRTLCLFRNLVNQICKLANVVAQQTTDTARSAYCFKVSDVESVSSLEKLSIKETAFAAMSIGTKCAVFAHRVCTHVGMLTVSLQQMAIYFFSYNSNHKSVNTVTGLSERRAQAGHMRCPSEVI